MPSCCVPGCKSRGRRLHRFPISDHRVYKIWITRIDNLKLFKLVPQDVYNKFRICDLHFDLSCSSPGTNRLKVGSLPTRNLPGDEEDNRTYEANDVFTITQDFIEAIIEVPQENANTSLPEERLLETETNTHKELSARLHHKNYKDFRQKTEKELEQILEFLINNKGDRIYKCPKCRYICGTVNEIRIHLIAHIERRLCDICFKIFNSEVGTITSIRSKNSNIP